MTDRRRGRDRTIDSPRNAAVGRARALERDRTAREREGTCLAWGFHLAEEALSAGARLREVFTGPRLEESPEGRALAGRLRDLEVPLIRTTTRVLESIVAGCGDQGILMEVHRPRHALRDLVGGPPSTVLMAHGVQDPGNLGSMVRTAWALGARGFAALEGCADPFGSRALRASMGAAFRLPVVCATSGRALEVIREAGFQVIAADARGGRPPTDIDLARPTVIVVGSEGSGLPDDLVRSAAARVRIPMAPGASSLNVHAAATALLYESFRQRGFGRLQ